MGRVWAAQWVVVGVKLPFWRLLYHGLPHALSQASWQDLKPPLLSLDLHAALLISGLMHLC